MNIKYIWTEGIKMLTIKNGHDVHVSMPELDKSWEWRKQPDCYHMPTFSTEENLLASIGLSKDDEHVCIDRYTYPRAYAYGAVTEVYTVYFMTNHNKYKVAEYVRSAGRPLLYLTNLWRLSIGLNTEVRMVDHHSCICKRIVIHSTQLMDLAFYGYSFLFKSNKDCSERERRIKSRVTNRYDDGVARFNQFLSQTRLAVNMMLYRDEAVSEAEKSEEITTIDFELYKFWRRCKRVVNNGVFPSLGVDESGFVALWT